MMMIRKARLDDIPAIVAIHRKSDHWLGAPHKVSYINALHEIHVCEVDGIVIGFVHYHARRDGWHTIYTIAVHPDYAGKQYGRYLLWSVPTPIRLKVTADNERAIRFYEALHMRHTSTETAKTGRALRVYELKRLFVQVAGNNRRFPDICKQAGIAYGSRHDDQIRAYPVMIDINWRKYDWNKYLAVIAQHKPIMAMVADYERFEQRRQLYQQIRDLKRLGVLRIMVCPKFDGAVKHIPSFCLVAVSLPSKYAGFVPDSKELVGRKLHLLGGSPSKQLTYIKNNPALNVISTDGNSHTGASAVHMHWDNVWVRRGHLEYYESIAQSARNIARALQTDIYQFSLF